jgi:porphobilinogen synthase
MNQRPRRNRRSAAIRGLAQETHLTVSHLVQPIFLVEGTNIKEEISSLPGSYRFSTDEAKREIESCMSLGLQSFILFPKIPADKKDKHATYSYQEDNFYLEAARHIKTAFPESCLISDVAMDPYNTDGHDGLVVDGRIDNDQSLPILQQMALAQAQAGFDLLGPSDMMDGRIQAIRDILDANGHYETGIMSYTAKYASSFYGPFRDALDSAPVESEDIPRDKKTYQMNPANRREALIEGMLDTEEGADFLMVKPALHYLDIIMAMKQNFELPIAAYHVSGECAMLIAACQNGWLDYEKAMPETLLSIYRAGADVIITYFAKDFAAQKMNIMRQ